MRILIVVHGYPPHAQGGSEIYAAAHAAALRSGGDEVVVLTRDNDRAMPEFEISENNQDGVRVVRVNNTFRDVRSFEESYEQPKIATIAAELISEFKPDVAHIHHLTCLSTLIPQRLSDAGVPIVMTLHDYWLLCHRGQLLNRHLSVCAESPASCTACIDAAVTAPAFGVAASVYRRLESVLPETAASLVRRVGMAATTAVSSPSSPQEATARRFAHMRAAAERCALMLAPSAHLRERFVAAGYPAERIRLSRYGFDPRPLPVARTRRSGPLRLGFVGSLMVSKGPHVLLEAARGLPTGSVSVELFGAHTAYHGDASYRRVLDPLLDTAGVTVHGPTDHATIGSAYAAMDVLVVPSIWPENSPLVIQEAFLAGVPVVASRIGGVTELVEHEKNGLLFDAGNAEALRASLQRLLDEPDLLERLGSQPSPVRTMDDDVRSMRAEYERLTAAPSSAGARVHAVVLNYGTPDATLIAVRSLLASRHALASVTVVDNSDNVECGRSLSSLSDRVDYLSSGTNLGYAAGMNLGIRRALAAGATHVLLVNSDMTVPPDCVGKLLEALTTSVGAGIAGPIVLARSTPDRIASLGLSYDLRTGRMRHRHYDEPIATAANATGRVDAVSGCLMLATREVLERVGLLDAEYFFGFEDLDFCLRASTCGFASVVAPVVSFHEGGQSLAPDSPVRVYYATRNHLRLASRLANVSSSAPRMLTSATILALNIAFALKAPPTRIRRRLIAVVRGALDYRRGRFGPAT